MHPDRKVGLAMGILLVGVVAALFFRNEDGGEDLPHVMRAAEMNERLRDREVPLFADDRATSDVSEFQIPDWDNNEYVNEMRNVAPMVPVPLQSDSSLTIESESAAQAVPELVGRPEGGAPRSIPPRSVRPENDTRDSGIRHVAPAAPGPLAAAVQQGDTPHAAPANDVAAESEVMYDEYRVRYGDTLSELAERFLGSQRLYTELYEHNKDRIPDPDRLRVNTTLRIPRRDSRLR